MSIYGGEVASYGNYRYYHNKNHIKQCFEVANELDIELGQAMSLAIFYHDVIYVPGNKNNEYQNIGLSNYTINMNSDAVSLALNLFTSTSYKTKKVKFFYKIAGVTSGFISNEEDNKILLQSLRYYRVNEVEIYAINSSGKKSENILKLNIYRTAPWWARIESFIIYVLLLVSLIFFVFKIREKQNNERQEGKRKAKEIEEAKNLQMSLLPKKTPVVEGLEITTYLKCASEVGGDYFDFLQSDTGSFLPLVGRRHRHSGRLQPGLHGL
jgi:hypothetical protein